MKPHPANEFERQQVKAYREIFKDLFGYSVSRERAIKALWPDPEPKTEPIKAEEPKGEPKGEMTMSLFAVINQWDDGRQFVTLVRAGNAEAAAKAKQKHLDTTSRQRNNRVIAVSDALPMLVHSALEARSLTEAEYEEIVPVASVTQPTSQRWAAKPLRAVQMVPIPQPVPKEVRIMGSFNPSKPAKSETQRYSNPFRGEYGY